MKKSEIQALLAGVSSIADVIAFAAANNLNVTIDPNSTDVQAAKDAVIALGQDDAPGNAGAGVPGGIDFGALMAGFKADAATIETPKARQARIIADVLSVTVNGQKINDIIKDVKVAGKVTIEKDNGVEQVRINVNAPLPAFSNGQIIPVFTVFTNPVILGSVLSMSDHGEIVDWCLKHTGEFANVLCDAKFDVLIQWQIMGEPTSNPFAMNGKVTIAPVNRINLHIVNLELGPKGLAEIKQVCDAQRMA